MSQQKNIYITRICFTKRPLKSPPPPRIIFKKIYLLQGAYEAIQHEFDPLSAQSCLPYR